jgi:hypothetical protein
VVFEPPQRREEHELHVRESVLVQRRADLSLPGQRDPPQQEARAVLRRREAGARSPGGYEERSCARVTSERIVSGKSAVISGPIC